MDVVYPRCCGLDVHKKTVVACILISAPAGPPTKLVRTFATMTDDLQRLAAWLREQQVTHGAMESTGVYWQPVYNVLEATVSCCLLIESLSMPHASCTSDIGTQILDRFWAHDHFPRQSSANLDPH